MKKKKMIKRTKALIMKEVERMVERPLNFNWQQRCEDRIDAYITLLLTCFPDAYDEIIECNAEIGSANRYIAGMMSLANEVSKEDLVLELDIYSECDFNL